MPRMCIWYRHTLVAPNFVRRLTATVFPGMSDKGKLLMLLEHSVPTTSKAKIIQLSKMTKIITMQLCQSLQQPRPDQNINVGDAQRNCTQPYYKASLVCFTHADNACGTCSCENIENVQSHVIGQVQKYAESLILLDFSSVSVGKLAFFHTGKQSSQFSLQPYLLIKIFYSVFTSL